MVNWRRVTNFATNQYAISAVGSLAGLAAGIGLTYSLMKDGEVKIPKPENVRVFEVSEDYTGVLVEPNGYFISISEKGELTGRDISKEKTPFVFTEKVGKDRSLTERTKEAFLEVSGVPLVIERPDVDLKITSTSFKAKRK